MLKFLNGLPQHTVGIEVEGTVTKEEYESVVVPKMKTFANREDEINYIVVLKSGLDSFTAGVWWEDFKMALKQFNKWNRVAIVTDQETVETATNIFGFAFPGQHRLFKLNQLDEAKHWVSAGHDH